MAITLTKSLAESVGTTAVDVYTVPSGTESHIVSCRLANTTGSIVPASVYVESGGDTVYIVKNKRIDNGQSVNVIEDGKIILSAGDVLYVQAATASAVDCIVSVMESA